MDDTNLMAEQHWCAECENPPGLTPERVERDRLGAGSVELVVTCPTHGATFHDPHETDCWCIK